jgi:hypothetical protein
MRYMSLKRPLFPTFMIVLAAGAIASASASLLTHSLTITNTVSVNNGSTFQITVHVRASDDDAGAWWDWSGYYWPWTLDKSHVSVGGFTSGSQYNGGLRFIDVNIPQGAHIVSVVLKVCSDQTCAGTGARWNVYGEDVGNSAQFSTKENFDIRPKTIAVKDTGFFTVWIEGTWYQVDGLTSVVQEIVNRPDWHSGNALTLLLFGHPEARTTHEVRSYDANPSQAATLEIAYET